MYRQDNVSEETIIEKFHDIWNKREIRTEYYFELNSKSGADTDKFENEDNNSDSEFVPDNDNGEESA